MALDCSVAISVGMTCIVCSRAHEPHARPETGSTCDSHILAETGTPEAYRKEEVSLFKRVTESQRFRARGAVYWLSKVRALTGKSHPDVIATLTTRWHQPIGITITKHGQSCVFLRDGLPRPLCICCALHMVQQRRLLLLIDKGDQVFTVNHRRRVNLRRLNACLSET